MAAPTVWGFTGVANTTKTFAIEGTNLYGVDLAGTLAPVRIPVAANIHILLTAAKTDAEVVAALTDFLKRHGSGHDGAGGFPSQATKQITCSLTTTS